MANKKKFRVVIAGSRGFNDYDLLSKKCNEFLIEKRKNYDVIVVSGGARGADKTGEEYAKNEGFLVEVYLADWDKYGKKAGFIRNCQMGEVADALIAFWDGESHGTKHMIEYCKSKGLDVRVVKYNG